MGLHGCKYVNTYKNVHVSIHVFKIYCFYNTFQKSMKSHYIVLCYQWANIYIHICKECRRRLNKIHIL